MNPQIDNLKQEFISDLRNIINADSGKDAQDLGQELSVLPVSIDYCTANDLCCIELRNERYYLAYETEPHLRISVLWSDLKFINHNFGIVKVLTGCGDDNSIVTKESLNHSRLLNFADYRKAIELGVHVRELKNLLPDGSFGTYESKDEFGRKIMVERTPEKLTKRLKQLYEIDMARGLYVVCKFVGELRTEQKLFPNGL